MCSARQRWVARNKSDVHKRPHEMPWGPRCWTCFSNQYALPPRSLRLRANLPGDPRVRVAVPIIAVPADALGRVHTARFRAEGVLGTDKMYYPARTKAFYEDHKGPGPYKGKKILALCGGVDEVIPPRLGMGEWNDVVDLLGKESAQMVVQDNAGHICTPEMVGHAADWFYKWGVNVQDGDKARL